MQLTPVGKEVLKAANQGAKLAEAGAADPTVAERLQKLKRVEALKKRQVGWPEIQELVGISQTTYNHWRKRLEEKGLAGLKPQSRRPKTLRTKLHWSPEVLLRIEALRKGNPTWGRWPIWLRLQKAGYTPVGRILAYLEKKGRVERVASFLA